MRRRKNALMPLFRNKLYFETRLLLLTDLIKTVQRPLHFNRVERQPAALVLFIVGKRF